jgi:hypothetical protein
MQNKSERAERYGSNKKSGAVIWRLVSTHPRLPRDSDARNAGSASSWDLGWMARPIPRLSGGLSAQSKGRNFWTNLPYYFAQMKIHILICAKRELISAGIGARFELDIVASEASQLWW